MTLGRQHSVEFDLGMITCLSAFEYRTGGSIFLHILSLIWSSVIVG